MSIVRRIIKNNIERLKVDELLAKEYEQAGYGGITLTKTPMGAQINLYAMRPGRVIGKRGRAIKAASERLETELGLPNPQITVIEVEVPELNPAIMAARIANALERGVHFRRSIFWSLRRIMDSGALGCEILLKGPLRSARSRFEKVVEGYVPKSGEPALRNVKTATIHVKMKRGTLGVTVKIVPPDAKFPDKISLEGLPDIEYQLPMEEAAPVAEIPAEAVVDETVKAVEPEAEAAEPVITDEAAPEEAPVLEETPVEEAAVEPAVEEAVVEESAPVEPTVEEPASEEVAEAVEEPAVEESIVEEAAVEAVEPEAAEPVVEEEAVVEEAVEEPAVEEPVAEVTEEPVAEASAVEETIEAAEPAVADEVVEEPAVEPVVEESAPEEAVEVEPEAVEEPQAEPVITESAPEVSEPEEKAAEPELVSEPKPVAETEEEIVEPEPKVKPKPEADMAEETTDDQPEEEKQ